MTKAKTKQSLFKLSCHANSSLTVASIRGILEIWEQSDWVPDVIVIDYADILARPGHFEGRDAIDENWKQLRALSQTRHCCVVTATQADAASYHAETLGRSNFTDDKRKLAHATAIIGINATAEEKEQGRSRLNYVVLRENEFFEYACCHVAGCLSIGNPAMRSIF